jgi:Tol biopolymer transport system component
MMRSLAVGVGAAVLVLATPASALQADPGRQLGFVRNGSIWLSAPNGQRAHVVVRRKSPYSYLEPAWSRGGTLAVTQYEETESHGYSRIAVIRAKRRRLFIGVGTFSGSPTWSPNGKLIAFVNYNYGTPPGGTLSIANLATRAVVPLGGGGGSPDDIDDEPAWSPAGRTIAFTRPEFDDSGNYVTRHLFVIGANGKGLRELTPSPAFNPSWSPDGRSIVFDNERAIYVIAADGTGQRRLTTSGTNSEPAWSPDGRRIAFQRGTAVWVMNADGTNAHRILRNAAQPAWD